MSIVFGPIPSRRLGRSLGINNIPQKYCTYSCIYCQVGSTDHLTATIRNFYPPTEIYDAVKSKIDELKSKDEKIDYLTFVPDGEPTLDINIGTTIDKLKSFGIKIAVITNASLMYNEVIRTVLKSVDWVSVKIDSADPVIWKKINRPHGSLRLQYIIDGLIEFVSEYKGELVTETMLVKDINDSSESLKKTAELINKINPRKAYILVPTRPPSEAYVNPPSESKINLAYQIFRDLNINTELITKYEGSSFTYNSDAENELLSILAVHPMRKDAVENFLLKSGNDWKIIEALINSNKVKEVFYNENSFLINCK